MSKSDDAKAEALRRLKAERRFSLRLRRLLSRLIISIPNTDDPIEFVRQLKRLSSNKKFKDECEKEALRIVNFIGKDQFKSWREAAAASSKGRKIFELLRKETAEDTEIGRAMRDMVRANAELIETCPKNIAKEITEMVRRRTLAGERPEAIMEEVLEKAPHLTEVEARRIARTEAAKTNTALREARAMQFNRRFYIWWDCSDERVRDSHRKMHGVLCTWDDPPNPELLSGESQNYGAYHPGCIFNCRCIPMSVISFSDLKFPIKCHRNGAIKQIGSIKALKDFYGLSDENDGQFTGRENEYKTKRQKTRKRK